MATVRRPGASVEQTKAVLQESRYLLNRQGAHARGGKLQGKRDAVELAAGLGDGVGILRREGEARQRGARSFDE